MKHLGMEGQAAHLGAGGGYARRVAPLIEAGLDAQPGGRPCVADQGDHRLEGAEGTPAPVLGDVAEASVLDLVPLVRAGRKVQDVDAQVEIIGEPLQAVLSCPGPIAIAAVAHQP